MKKIPDSNRFDKSILIEGLPGNGLVASICAMHLIINYNATKIYELHSPFFQDFSITTKSGLIYSLINEFYYAKIKNENIIILFGNTQASTVYGQYELAEQILFIAKKFGCKMVVSMDSFQSNKIVEGSKIYCTATDPRILSKITNLGVDVFHGNIQGISGLLVGLAKIRNLDGFCLMVETAETNLNVDAILFVLKILNSIFKFQIRLDNIENTVERICDYFKNILF